MKKSLFEKKPLFEIKKTDVNAINLKHKFTKSGQDLWFLLRSDVHHDNPHSNRELEEKHLKEAKKRGAGVIDAGDLFCAMQGKYDPRSSKMDIRPEHQTHNYLDSLVSTASDFYEPYAQNFISLGYGNHETAIIKRHETDLTQRLASVLNDRTGSRINVLGYTGWITFQFRSFNQSFRRVLWFTHGYGGGGPVSQDIIQSARQRVYIENADIMLSGHVHRSWVQEFVKSKINLAGKIETRYGYYVKTPTYKDSYGKGVGGFEVERGMGPRPIGAYWLHFIYNRTTGLDIEIIKAN